MISLASDCIHHLTAGRGRLHSRHVVDFANGAANACRLETDLGGRLAHLCVGGVHDGVCLDASPAALRQIFLHATHSDGCPQRSACKVGVAPWDSAASICAVNAVM